MFRDFRTIAFGSVWLALLACNVSRPTCIGSFLAIFATFQGCVATHNAMHSPTFHNPTAQSLFRCALTIWQGGPVATYRPGHNRTHHAYLETTRDPGKTSQMCFTREIFNVFLYFPTVMPRIVVTDNRYLKDILLQCNEELAQLVLETLVYAGFVMSLLRLAGAPILVVFYLIPSLFGKGMIVTLNYLQHNGCDAKSDFAHSRNFTGPILNFLCFNNGFHTVHHNAPRLHWTHLPAEHARIAPKIPPHLNEGNILTYLVRLCASKKATKVE
jgi:fatty acid desaturase